MRLSPRKRNVVNTKSKSERLESGTGHRDVEAAAIVARSSIVDAQVERARPRHCHGFARANKAKPRGHDANPCDALGAIDRAETFILDPRLGNEDADQCAYVRYPPTRKADGFLKG